MLKTLLHTGPLAVPDLRPLRFDAGLVPRAFAPRWPRLLLALTPLALGACASLSPDAGMAPVEVAARQQLHAEVAAARTPQDQDRLASRVAELLRQPLSADAAVQVALLNNRGLQASLQSLGIAEAELVQASRLPNPRFSFGRLQRGDEREIERSVGFDLGSLVSLPMRRAMLRERQSGVQREVTLEMLRLAADTRKAYVVALAAEQTLAYRRDAQEAAEAGAELARRMQKAGNWNALDQAREEGFLAETRLAVLRAELLRTSSRERLVRLLGLEDDKTLQLPDRLPDLPAEAEPRQGLEQQALTTRLDLQAARAQLDASARALGLQRVTRFVDGFELALKLNSARGEPRQTGGDLSFEIPLFDWGEARTAQAEARYLQEAHRVAQRAVEARSEVREAYQAYRAAHDVARHYRDELLPLARRVSQEQLLRYNGMFIGVFELLADARAQIGVVNGSIEALRDFWLAQAELDLALVGRPGPVTLGAAAPDADRPRAGGH